MKIFIKTLLNCLAFLFIPIAFLYLAGVEVFTFACMAEAVAIMVLN